MNYQTLRDEILISPRQSTYASNVVTSDMAKENAALKDQAIADLINADQSLFVVFQPITVKAGDFLRKLGPVNGATLYDKIETESLTYGPLKRIVAEMNGDGLDVSTEEELNGFCELLATNTTLTTTDISYIKSVFYQKIKVTGADVSIALRGNATFGV